MASARMTFTVPPTLKQRAQAHPEINWSAVVAQAIERRLDLWERLEAFAQDSRLTGPDIDAAAAAIDRNMARRHRAMHRGS